MLFYIGSDDQKLKLDWSRRKKICMQIACGLAYLHEESRLKIVHRDMKATNVLLDKDLNAKISDFVGNFELIVPLRARQGIKGSFACKARKLIKEWIINCYYHVLK
ncbi:putative protein kinase RLK-Pelle-DLSV family [Helianthus annuus]|nr:putative protein kinase RLK-Pelle-DLSV family [Helianthus annuus]